LKSIPINIETTAITKNCSVRVA